MSAEPASLVVEYLDDAVHDRQGFDCGVEALNTFLQTQARKEMERRSAITYVLVDPAAPSQIIGFYSLSAATVLLDSSVSHSSRPQSHLSVAGAHALVALDFDVDHVAALWGAGGDGGASHRQGACRRRGRASPARQSIPLKGPTGDRDVPTREKLVPVRAPVPPVPISWLPLNHVSSRVHIYRPLRFILIPPDADGSPRT